MHYYSVNKALYIPYALYKKVPHYANFTAKFEFVFGLTQENDFSEKFGFKVNKDSVSFSKKLY